MCLQLRLQYTASKIDPECSVTRFEPLYKCIALISSISLFLGDRGGQVRSKDQRLELGPSTNLRTWPWWRYTYVELNFHKWLTWIFCLTLYLTEMENVHHMFHELVSPTCMVGEGGGCSSFVAKSVITYYLPLLIKNLSFEITRTCDLSSAGPDDRWHRAGGTKLLSRTSLSGPAGGGRGVNF